MRPFALALLLALGAACRAQPYAGDSTSYGARMLAANAAYPTFAGWYAGGGAIHVNATGPIDGPGVVAYVDRLSGGSFNLDPAARVETHPVRYTYAELDAWQRGPLRDALPRVGPYLIGYGIDDRHNRISLHFARGLEPQEIEAWLRSLPVPRDALDYLWGGVLNGEAETVPRQPAP